MNSSASISGKCSDPRFLNSFTRAVAAVAQSSMDAWMTPGLPIAWLHPILPHNPTYEFLQRLALGRGKHPWIGFARVTHLDNDRRLQERRPVDNFGHHRGLIRPIQQVPKPSSGIQLVIQ